MREQWLCHIDIFCVVPGVFAHRKQQLVNFDRTIIHLLDDLFYVVYFVITWTSQRARCIMGHMGSKQSLSAYQILSRSSDSSAVCSGCHGCCHSNLVSIDGLLLSARLESCFDNVTMWPILLFELCSARYEQSVTIPPTTLVLVQFVCLTDRYLKNKFKQI